MLKGLLEDDFHLKKEQTKKKDDEGFITEKIQPRREVMKVFKIMVEGDLRETTVPQT